MQLLLPYSRPFSAPSTSSLGGMKGGATMTLAAIEASSGPSVMVHGRGNAPSGNIVWNDALSVGGDSYSCFVPASSISPLLPPLPGRGRPSSSAVHPLFASPPSYTSHPSAPPTTFKPRPRVGFATAIDDTGLDSITATSELWQQGHRLSWTPWTSTAVQSLEAAIKTKNGSGCHAPCVRAADGSRFVKRELRLAVFRSLMGSDKSVLALGVVEEQHGKPVFVQPEGIPVVDRLRLKVHGQGYHSRQEASKIAVDGVVACSPASKSEDWPPSYDFGAVRDEARAAKRKALDVATQEPRHAVGRQEPHHLVESHESPARKRLKLADEVEVKTGYDAPKMTPEELARRIPVQLATPRCPCSIFVCPPDPISDEEYQEIRESNRAPWPNEVDMELLSHLPVERLAQVSRQDRKRESRRRRREERKKEEQALKEAELARQALDDAAEDAYWQGVMDRTPSPPQEEDRQAQLAEQILADTAEDAFWQEVMARNPSPPPDDGQFDDAVEDTYWQGSIDRTPSPSQATQDEDDGLFWDPLEDL